LNYPTIFFEFKALPCTSDVQGAKRFQIYLEM
jgi:hypothetical protein